MDGRRNMLLYALLGLLALALSTCSEQRPLYPEIDELALILHEPFENREAEELALELSAQLIAPRHIYERVLRDLAAIRAAWADSMPVVARSTFKFRHVPGEVVIFLHDEIDVPEWLQRTTEFDVFRNQYGFDSITVADNRIALRSRYLLNTTHLLKKLERLPGVCWAQQTIQSGDRLIAIIDGDSTFYEFYNGGGICFDFCIPSRHLWFVADPRGVDYIGEHVWAQRDSIPDQFKYPHSLWLDRRRNPAIDSIVFRDETPPARATDLKFVGDQVGRTGTVTFTATGDDINEGAAYSSTVCLSTQPITFENFNTIGYYYIKVNPGYSGDQHTLHFTNLSGNATNYCAVRFVDCNQNVSPVSNIAESRNIWLNGWTYFTAENSPLPDNRIRVMFSDSRDRMWIGTFNGLVCKDGEQWNVYQTSNSGLPYNLINSIAEAPNGDIWIGTPRGLGRFDGNQWQSFTKSNSTIPKEEITTIAVANDGAVWLGFGPFSLIRYHNNTWTTYNLSNSPIGAVSTKALFADSRGNLWIGTNWGVTRFDGQSWTAFDPSSSGPIGFNSLAFLEDQDGRIWCASSLGTVSWFDGTTWKSSSTSGGQGKSLAQFEDGPLWVGTDVGLWRTKSDDWIGFSGATTGLATNHCTSLIADGPNTLWIGTADKGLCRWDLKVAKLSQTFKLVQSDE